jgi:hypothetical protein
MAKSDDTRIYDIEDAKVLAIAPNSVNCVAPNDYRK